MDKLSLLTYDDLVCNTILLKFHLVCIAFEHLQKLGMAGTPVTPFSPMLNLECYFCCMIISCLVFFSYSCSEMRNKSITSKYTAMSMMQKIRKDDVKDEEVKLSAIDDNKKWREEKAVVAEKVTDNGRNKELYNMTKTIAGEEISSRRERLTRGVFKTEIQERL